MKARRDYTIEALQENSSIANYNDLMRHAKSCCNQTSIRAMVEGLKSTLSCNATIFDTQRHLINVLNGTNGKGVITDCHYYDRKYKERSKVVPETLTTVFF